MEVSKSPKLVKADSQEEALENAVEVNRDPVDDDLNGNDLLQTVVSLTGLPEPLVFEELDQLVEQSGKTTEALTLDELRVVMLKYLEEVQAGLVEN
jgi:hypothetical protein